jgi:dolichol-phosphate mannosyltransferase
VVVTLREEDPSVGWFKRFSSRCYFHLMRLLSDTQVREAASDYQLLSRKALDALLQLHETHRFLRGMVNWLGFPTAAVTFRPAARTAGVSKFTLFRLTNFAVDGLLSFSKAPVRLALFAGLAVIAAGLGLAACGAVAALLGGVSEPVAGAALVAVHLIGGAILCAIGLVGEYVGRVYEQVKGRPLYLLKETCPEWEDAADSTDLRPARKAT